MAELSIDESPFEIDTEHGEKLFQAHFISDSHVATLAQDNTIRVIDYKSGAIKRVITGQFFMRALASARNGWLFSGNDIGDIDIWIPLTGKLVATIPNPQAPIYALRVIHDVYLAAVCRDNTIKIWNILEITRKNKPLLSMT